MHPHHTVMGWYPWNRIRPLVVGRKLGNGRAVYVAAELDGASLRFGDPQSLTVLACAVRWAGQGQAVLHTNVPPSVETTIHGSRDGKKRCVVLTNETTNQRYPDPIRYIVPIRDVEVGLNVSGQRVERVDTVTGQAVQWSQTDGWLNVRVERLEAYEALLIDLA